MKQLTNTQESIILDALKATADTPCTITLTQLLDSNENCYLVEFAFDGEKSAAVYYPTLGIVDSLTDWQSGAYPTTLPEIPNYEWRCDY